MTSELVTAQSVALERPATATEIRAQVNLIQEVMRAVMTRDTHYGQIPGTNKPTLYKAGAEKILMTFRIAASVKQIEDLSSPDEIRYRVTVQGVAQNSGRPLGEGVGECSSSEEKYRWRRPVHPKEFDAAPEDRRREKWTRDGETWQQVRTEPADVANTVLKMAHKRALVAMTLVVTAASDVFSQDIEDLPEEVRESVVGDDAPAKPAIRPPARRSEGGAKAAPTGLHIKGVERKTGETNGHKWALYIVKLSDGREASTLDEGVGTLAQRLHADGATVDVTVEPGKKAGSLKLTELVRASEPSSDDLADREPGSDDE